MFHSILWWAVRSEICFFAICFVFLKQASLGTTLNSIYGLCMEYQIIYLLPMSGLGFCWRENWSKKGGILFSVNELNFFFMLRSVNIYFKKEEHCKTKASNTKTTWLKYTVYMIFFIMNVVLQFSASYGSKTKVKSFWNKYQLAVLK